VGKTPQGAGLGGSLTFPIFLKFVLKQKFCTCSVKNTYTYYVAKNRKIVAALGLRTQTPYKPYCFFHIMLQHSSRTILALIRLIFIGKEQKIK